MDLLEKQTKPKPLHTESSLLAAMENAGRELEDAELKASLKAVSYTHLDVYKRQPYKQVG